MAYFASESHAYRRLVIGALSAVVLATSSCSVNPTAAASAAPQQTEEAILDRLYFGRTIPSGGTVSEAEWRTFLAEVVTPRFPEGFSVLRGEGQWRDAKGVIWKEDGFVLEVTHPAVSSADTAVRAIMREYNRRFKQDAVMRTQTRVRWEFETGRDL